ncbi:MAG: M20 family metallopeptidase [Nitrospinota bacterium]
MSEMFALIKKEVKRISPEVARLNRLIFENPELNYKELFAAELLTSSLKEQGFRVRRGGGKLKTAFEAAWRGGKSKPVVALLAEYDALPKMGHACGHNLIAAGAFGAAVAVKNALGKKCGTLKVIGTPAEEGGGGKLLMIRGGWFKGVDAAIMAHPSNKNRSVARMLAVMELDFHYYGKASHAAAYPDKGINALDAVIALFNSVNAMRQQTPDFARVHGIITSGGDAPNIIPEQASARFMVRGLTMPEFRVMLKKVTDCAKGAARATGCRLKIVKNPLAYEPFEPSRALGAIFSRYMQRVRLKESGAGETDGMGSSDVGNLSQVVPTLHPEYAVGGEDTVNHSREFLKAVVSKKGEAAMIKAATAAAATAAELFTNPSAVRVVKKEFQDFKKKNRN